MTESAHDAGSEREAREIIEWADGLLESAEKWPDDGPHLQPKQFVRALVRQVKASAASSAEVEALREAIEHVVNDSPGTPDSVKGYLRDALAAHGEGGEADG